MDTLKARLTEAIRAGESLRIAYHGGSQPSAARKISPMVVTGDSVFADDLPTGELWTFKLECMGLIAPDAPATAYDPSREPAPEPNATLVETLAPFQGELEALGWHVELTETHVGVGRFLKNGRPRKSRGVELTFRPTTIDCFDDFDGRGLQTAIRCLQPRPIEHPHPYGLVARRGALFGRRRGITRPDAPRPDGSGTSQGLRPAVPADHCGTSRRFHEVSPQRHHDSRSRFN